MSVRERPWHGLGVVLAERPRDIDEAIDKSGIGWLRVQEPVHRADGRVVEGWMQNIRQDTDQVLGVVTTKWQGPQNREAFEFLAGLLGSEAAFETAGSLHGGAKVFITVSLAELPYVTVGGDRTDLFVNFFTDHTGKGSSEVLRTMIRTVCMNTWMGALRDARYRYAFRHVGDQSVRLAEARRELELTIDYAAQFKQFGDELASQSIAERELARITEELWPGEGHTPRTAKTHQEKREAVMHLFIDGDTRGNAPGTKWCAANALLEHIEWAPKVRSDSGRFTRHIEDPQGLKATALEMVVMA